jgi:hypothetical protein
MLFAKHRPLRLLAFQNWSLKRVLKDCEFNSSDEIERAATKGWDELTFDEVHSVFHNWLNHLALVIENGGDCFIE